MQTLMLRAELAWSSGPDEGILTGCVNEDPIAYLTMTFRHHPNLHDDQEPAYAAYRRHDKRLSKCEAPNVPFSANSR